MGRRIDAALHAAWRKRCERFDDSALTAAEFCRREGVSQAAFYLWRKRLAQEARSPTPTTDGEAATAGNQRERPAAFVELSVVPAAVVEIELPNGALVRVPADREATLIATLRTVGGLERREPLTRREATTC